MYDPRAEESVGREGHIPRSLLDPCPEGQKRSDKRAALKSPRSQYADGTCRQVTYFEPADVDLILVALYPRSVDGPERNTLQLLDRSGSPAVEPPAGAFGAGAPRSTALGQRPGARCLGVDQAGLGSPARWSLRQIAQWPKDSSLPANSQYRRCNEEAHLTAGTRPRRGIGRWTGIHGNGYSTNAKRPHGAGVSKNPVGGKCKFRTCDPCSVNAVLYP